jgi:hypothetical protein
MSELWPVDFSRVPRSDWTTSPIDTLARKYDSLESHGWYLNLEPTLTELHELIRPGHLWCDYSGGTGILVDWLLRRWPELRVGMVVVDSSPKFLRLAVEKLSAEERVAFRHIAFLKEHKRLQMLDEVLDGPLLERKLDGLVSTNAIHLYYDLPETVASWVRCLRHGAPILVQSGNIRNPEAEAGSWIIDETVVALGDIAIDLVRTDPMWAAYRNTITDTARMEQHAALRRKYFLPVRPLEHYVRVFAAAGVAVERVVCRPIMGRVLDWYEFLAAYHDGVLGWVGGVEKIEGKPPSTEAIRDRLSLMKQAVDRLFEGGHEFRASWTYMTCRVP